MSTPPATPNPNFDALLNFLSDERLKKNVRLKEENGAGMGISIYTYEWTTEAKRLYNKTDGEKTGVLMGEVEKVFPAAVRWTPYGHKMFVHSAASMPKVTDFRFLVYVSLLMLLYQSDDTVPVE